MEHTFTGLKWTYSNKIKWINIYPFYILYYIIKFYPSGNKNFTWIKFDCGYSHF